LFINEGMRTMCTSKRAIVGLAAFAVAALEVFSPGSALAAAPTAAPPAHSASFGAAMQPSTTGSNLNCNYTVNRPNTGYGGVGFSASANCLKTVYGHDLVGPIWSTAVLWDYESDNRYHLIAHASGPSLCFPFFLDVVCAMTPSGFSGVYPPRGNYHTQLLVWTSFIYGWPGCGPCLLVDANSDGLRV
jgi:hypothetical protein